VRVFGFVAVIVGTIFLGAGLMIWAIAPDLTAMQAFQNLAPMWAAGCVCGLLGIHCIDRPKH
jgi:hypothetical protein